MSFLNQRDAPEIRRDIHDWKKEMRNHNDICPYMLSDRIFPISLCIMTYIIYLIHDWNKWIWGEEIETYALLFSLRGRNMRDNQPSLLRSVQLESLLGSTQPPLPISHFKPFPSRFRTFPSITVHRVLRRRISPWPAESCWWMKWYALPSGLPYGLLARTNAGSLYSTMGGWVSLLRH